MQNTSEIGRIGEDLAVEYLQRRGFTIRDRNYRAPYAEIDVIAEKEAVLHFVEVKSVSYETRLLLIQDVSHETWQPEELVTAQKIHKISNGAAAWVSSRGYMGNYQIDVISVRFVPRETYAQIKYLPNV